MSLSYFHAIIRERRRYGAIGWNKIYDFNESDFYIAKKQLLQTINSYGNANQEGFPYDSLIYLTGQCYYGGKVTDLWDGKLLVTLLEDFYRDDVVAGSDFPICPEVPGFVIPEKMEEIETTIELLQNMPDSQNPLLFGLHPNAEISRAKNQGNFIIQQLLLTAGGSGGGSDTIQQTLKNLIDLVPKQFNAKEVQAKFPQNYNESMGTVLI
jgi:dynein heavy chain, axonemal